MAFRMKGWSGFTKATDNKMKRGDGPANKTRADMQRAAEAGAQIGGTEGVTERVTGKMRKQARAQAESREKQPGSMKFQKTLRQGLKRTGDPDKVKKRRSMRKSNKEIDMQTKTLSDEATKEASPMTIQRGGMKWDKKIARQYKRLPDADDSEKKAARKWKRHDRRMEKEMSRSGEDRKARRASRKADKEASPMTLKKFAKKAIGATPIGMLANKLRGGGKAKRARGQAQAATGAAAGSLAAGAVGMGDNAGFEEIGGGKMGRAPKAQRMQAAPLREASPYNMPQRKTKIPKKIWESEGKTTKDGPGGRQKKQTTKEQEKEWIDRMRKEPKRRGGIISNEESHRRTMERWKKEGMLGGKK